MREFCKWLGLNEKIAKLVVWFLITSILLIVINTTLESLGLPFYKITVDNLTHINTNQVIEVLLSWIVAWLNYYAVMLLVFRINDFKKLFKYSILFLVLQFIVESLFGYLIAQIYIFIAILIICFIFSKNNWRYILYGIGSLVLNTLLQYVCYLYKARFIDLTKISFATKSLLGLDFFIIMAVIIFVKEIIVKRIRGENNDKQLVMVANIRKGKECGKKTSNKINKNGKIS